MEKVAPKGEKGVPKGVSKLGGNRLKSTLWPNWGNGVSKLVPSGAKKVPDYKKMLPDWVPQNDFQAMY